MKLSIIILLLGAMHVSAAVSAQKITISRENAPLEKILGEIERQSGYQVWYEEGTLPSGAVVNVAIKDATLEEALNACLSGQHLKWTVIRKTIVLKKDAALPFLPQPPEKIRGVVKDAVSGEPMPGASVQIRGTSKATVTNASGEFELETDAREVMLDVSFVGYESQLVKASGKRSVTILLIVSTSKLEELIITGYSAKKTGELTGAVQKISGETLRKGITTSDPVSLLKGRATGLYISEQGAGDPTSAGGQIFVRGQSSVVGVGVDQYNEFVMPTQNYGPLLVLDGVIMPNQNLKELVNVQDIDNLTILKDAAATAIYGSRAAAGVIVVTTKKGMIGKPQMLAEVKYGINQPNRGSTRFLSGPELYDLQKRYYTEDYRVNNGSLAPQYPTLEDYLDDRLPDMADVQNSYDWQKYAFIRSNTKEVNLSARGGTENSRYYIGGTYYDEQSTGVNNGLKRGTFRVNLENRLTKRLTTNISLNGIFDKGTRENSNSGTFLYGMIPWVNPYNADGSPKPFLEYKMNGRMQKRENPIFENQFNYMHLKAQRFNGSIKADYRFTDWLSFSSTNSANLNYTKDERYIDVRSFAGSGTTTSSKGFLGTNTNQIQSFLTSNQLNFQKAFGSHSLRALVATEYGRTKMENILVNVNNVRAGYPVITLGRQIGNRYDYSIYGIPTTKNGNVEGGKEDRASFSAFGEAGYTYDNRYSVSASLRTDASSSFGADKRYGTFYSLGGAWVISNERFADRLGFLTNLKLRSNYGTSGSQLGDNFLTSTLYDPRYTYSMQPGAIITVLANPDLQWEITKTFSAGVDFGLFNKVTASVDYYHRRSEDLLQKVTLSAISGFPTQWQNVATVQNKGWEVLINSDNITGKNFQWNTSFNISFNRNKIINVANDSLRQGFYNANSFYLFPGDDINSLKAVKYAGVDPETGKPRFEKLIFDDKGQVAGVTYVNTMDEVGAAADPRQFQYIGNFQPKFFGGLTNNFTYKNFSLNVLITFAYGYVITDDLAEQNQGSNITSYNQLAYRKHQKQWTTPGQTDATEPELYTHANTDYFGSSKYMHDGSHARLRTVRLGYDLPKPWLRKLGISQANFYVSGDNLYTLYSREIISSDPEGPSVGQAQDFGGSIGSGIGIPRRYVFGLQVGF
ncbi:SusC/RagA family TonB-linked outer membrane protein [Chitinophaga cymbidii]|uniref:SusC/RagA family TonB-linked outer membrane protein n=1 Tax=Chitinophaga cymbidii TaxID=1096750 RepID=A0A512RKR4_9BACT|nr:SusC/RagA family TonB-linked outer membrane protein [Chitinophaga cymbidii]GEP96296.1 SusC/RagA family TonB-linked outer membrane protein [Chitinophaga cymbidii]